MPVQGLLQKANLLQSEGLAFFDFIAHHKIHNCAFLNLNSLNYSITDSYGFDAESILSSISTSDFWNGTIPEVNKIYSFIRDDNSINVILQLFSSQLKETVDTIQIIKQADNSIFILINQNITDEILKDLKSLKLTAKRKNKYNTFFSNNVITKKYKLHINPFVENYLKTKNLNSSLLNVFSVAVYKEIQLRLFFAFNDYSHITEESLYDYQITIQQLKEYPLSLLKIHIVSLLNDILPVDEDNIILTEA